MKSKTFWAAAGRALAVVTVSLIVVALVSASAAAPTCHKFKTTHKFTGGTDGNNPAAGLVFDAAGNLYGTTTGGGTGTCSNDTSPGCGTVFRLTPNGDGSWKETVIHTFTGYPTDGAYPVARVTVDAAGNVYGTAANEGTNACHCGLVFKLSPNPDGSWTESLLYSFTGGKDGAAPDATLIFDAAGSLYTTAFLGGFETCDDGSGWGSDCGLVFKLTPNPDGSWTRSVLHRFKGGADGSKPWHAGLSFDPAGNLFGTTSYGGSHNSGTIFRLTPNPDGTWKKKTLHDFTGGKGGGTPRGRTIFDPSGNLYGLTSAGGKYGNGTVYRLTPGLNNKWTYRVIHHFKGGRDGVDPYANEPVMDLAGNLYGATHFGGAYGMGIAFKLTPNPDGSWKESLLHTFKGGRDGNNPYASGLILDGTGNLYGTAFGPYGCQSQQQCGTVFEITP